MVKIDLLFKVRSWPSSDIYIEGAVDVCFIKIAHSLCQIYVDFYLIAITCSSSDSSTLAFALL